MVHASVLIASTDQCGLHSDSSLRNLDIVAPFTPTIIPIFGETLVDCSKIHLGISRFTSRNLECKRNNGTTSETNCDDNKFAGFLGFLNPSRFPICGLHSCEILRPPRAALPNRDESAVKVASSRNELRP